MEVGCIYCCLMLLAKIWSICPILITGINRWSFKKLGVNIMLLVALLFCIWEVPDSNLSQEASCSERFFFFLSLQADAK
jgi:uncharacterized membrane protein YqjE